MLKHLQNISYVAVYRTSIAVLDLLATTVNEHEMPAWARLGDSPEPRHSLFPIVRAQTHEGRMPVSRDAALKRQFLLFRPYRCITGGSKRRFDLREIRPGWSFVEFDHARSAVTAGGDIDHTLQSAVHGSVHLQEAVRAQSSMKRYAS